MYRFKINYTSCKDSNIKSVKNIKQKVVKDDNKINLFKLSSNRKEPIKSMKFEGSKKCYSCGGR